MIIRSIRLVNFGLYAGEQSLEPAVGRMGKGSITLVGGLNGRGKTSLLEAILLNLYGNRSPMVRERGRSYSTYLASLIHKGAPPQAVSSVELELEVPFEGDPTRLRIRRSWRVANVRAADRLEVWREGVSDPHLAENWDTYVEELMPLGVSGLFFFDGEKISALAEQEETDESVRIAIRSLLGLDVVDRLIADLTATVKRHRSQMRQIEGADTVLRLDDEIAELEQRRQRVGQENASLGNEIPRAESALRDKEEAYLQLGGRVMATRGGLEKEQDHLRERAAKGRAELASLVSGPLPLVLVSRLLETVYGVVSTDRHIEQARALLPLLEERDRRVLALVGETVSSPDILRRIETVLANERSRLEATASSSPRLGLSAVGCGQLGELVRSGTSSLRGQAAKLFTDFHATEGALERVNQRLLFRADEETVSSTLSELAAAAKGLADLQHQRDRLQKDIASLGNTIKQVQLKRKAALDTVLSKADALDDVKRKITLALRSQETQRAFSQEVTKLKIDALGRSVAEAFGELTHKTGLISEVRFDPETLHMSLYDSDGGEVQKFRLSSGEKQMLAVAVLWGLARASQRELPVIIDTPMGRLDSSHRMNFVTRYLPRASHQVIVLSTDTEIVGPYLQSLDGAVGRQYLLDYDARQKRTSVGVGYFAEPQEAIP